jgi:glucokinase
MRAVIAVDVGGTTIKGALVDASGVVVDRSVRPTGHGEDAAEAVVGATVLLADSARRRGLDVAAIGVVTPGIVDGERGVVAYASNLGWREMPLRDRVTAATGARVVLGHDVRAAGEAEGLFGAARDCRDYLHVVIGTGIAATVVADGRPVLGSAGGAGEIGHVPVHDVGEPCGCGQLGCLEVYASAGGLARRYERLAGRPGSAADVHARLGDDPVADQVWADAVAALVRAIATVALVLEPERVVLGGGLALAGEDLRSPVVAGLRGALAWRTPPEVCLSELGPDAAVRGAALLAARSAGIEIVVPTP